MLSLSPSFARLSSPTSQWQGSLSMRERSHRHLDARPGCLELINNPRRWNNNKQPSEHSLQFHSWAGVTYTSPRATLTSTDSDGWSMRQMRRACAILFMSGDLEIIWRCISCTIKWKQKSSIPSNLSLAVTRHWVVFQDEKHEESATQLIYTLYALREQEWRYTSPWTALEVWRRMADWWRNDIRRACAIYAWVG